jgi:hypothetical protein
MPSADLAEALRTARAELDRAIALLEPGAALDVVFTAVDDTELDAGSLESMRRELERFRLAEGGRAARRIVSDLLRGAAGDGHVPPGSLSRLAASE